MWSDVASGSNTPHREHWRGFAGRRQGEHGPHSQPRAHAIADGDEPCRVTAMRLRRSG
jgi:hypothetical protein